MNRMKICYILRIDFVRIIHWERFLTLPVGAKYAPASPWATGKRDVYVNWVVLFWRRGIAVKWDYLSGGEDSLEFSRQCSLNLVCSATTEFIFGGIRTPYPFFNRHWFHAWKTIVNDESQLLESLATIRSIPLVSYPIGWRFNDLETAGIWEIGRARQLFNITYLNSKPSDRRCCAFSDCYCFNSLRNRNCFLRNFNPADFKPENLFSFLLTLFPFITTCFVYVLMNVRAYSF